VNRPLLTAAICLITALSTGCQPALDASDLAGTPASEDAPPAAAASTEPPERLDPAITMSITPDPLDFCQGSGLAQVTVDWDMGGVQLPHYTVQVDAPGVPRKVWVATAAPAGSKLSGEWVREGTRFSIVDGTGVVIASRTVGSAPCEATAD
jgi:hypothetical protein